jgi:hypothetical protein
LIRLSTTIRISPAYEVHAPTYTGVSYAGVYVCYKRNGDTNDDASGTILRHPSQIKQVFLSSNVAKCTIRAP